MSIAAGLVLFVIIWLLCFLAALPMRIRSQEESGNVVDGTPSSAPENPLLRTKVKWATVAAIAIWIPIAVVLHWDIITIEDIDYFNRWGDGKYG